MRRSTAVALTASIVLGGTCALWFAVRGTGEADTPPVTMAAGEVCAGGVDFFSWLDPVLLDVEQITAKEAAALHDELDPDEQTPWKARDENEPIAKCLMRFNAEGAEDLPSEVMYVLIAADGARETLPAPDTDSS